MNPCKCEIPCQQEVPMWPYPKLPVIMLSCRITQAPNTWEDLGKSKCQASEYRASRMLAQETQALEHRRSKLLKHRRPKFLSAQVLRIWMLIPENRVATTRVWELECQLPKCRVSRTRILTVQVLSIEGPNVDRQLLECWVIELPMCLSTNWTSVECRIIELPKLLSID